ncbi:aldose 1-epimerase family protein [Corynebacterium sp. sy039]|uniref:aldose 1-epimerase family protein n=1 Tax=Corynebacterium sp. sy039 TaxID=2599641 RepID=UPI0011B7C468|nr:aldose 1-epimerase family protein [Corynebacterium sp. sy039]QDZ42353.1 aldose 1-epimerase family protein [Corynebacterium sp. sy039]
MTPSGNAYTVIKLGYQDYEAEISTYGGGIKALTYKGKNLVEPYPDSMTPPMASGVVLAPWPNRIEDGRYQFQGKSYQLPITEPERANAIHGLVLDRIWQVIQAHPHSVELGISCGPELGFPWQIDIRARYVLDGHGLHADFIARTPYRAAPYAFGLHTYLCAQDIDPAQCVLQVSVDKQLALSDQRKLPQGIVKATRRAADLAAGIALRGQFFDDCFYWSGSGGVRAQLEHNGCGVEMLCSPNLRWQQIFTPHDFPTSPTGRAVAIEPMSAPPNAFVTGTDLVVLTAENSVEHKILIRALENS